MAELTKSFPYMEVNQSKRSFILTAIPGALLTRITYASVRRRDDEEGAVQRILNQSRISGVKGFALNGGDFPTSIVLNWVAGKIVRKGKNILLSDKPKSAQLLDGQHRVAGLAAAIEEKPELGDQLFPVAIYEGLNTKDCADIFLSINTEQRPVPRSLVFDLYGIADEGLIDHAAVRARDIAFALNDPLQAYSELIKFPNSPRQRGGVALSTAVTAIKPLVEEKGLFDQIGISELEMQKSIFQNYFSVLAEKYGDRWIEKDNAFLYAAGFVGAIEFLTLKIIPYCNTQKSFTMKTISDAVQLDQTDLITQEEIKGIGGRDAPRKIYERLVNVFNPKTENLKHFEI